LALVRSTEVRIAPEVGGQLAVIRVHKGDRIRAGDVVAELSPTELTASVGQAPPTETMSIPECARSRSPRWRAEIAKAKSRLEYGGAAPVPPT
jgi:HlyD family secretion protein